MSKVLTDTEVLEIVRLAIEGDALDCADTYTHFLEGLGRLIADNFGGEFITTSSLSNGAAETYCLHFQHDECVPEDGGIYANFDTDVTIKEWIEDSKERRCLEDDYTGDKI